LILRGGKRKRGWGIFVEKGEKRLPISTSRNASDGSGRAAATRRSLRPKSPSPCKSQKSRVEGEFLNRGKGVLGLGSRGHSAVAWLGMINKVEAERISKEGGEGGEMEKRRKKGIRINERVNSGR